MPFTKINNWLLIILTSLVWNSTSYAEFGDTTQSISWAGCGVTKKAFMTELALGFEKKYGVNVVLHGGGATKGIRDTAKLNIDFGGTCRMTLPELDKSEMHTELHPVAWDALAIIVHPDNPVGNLSEKQIRSIYKGKIKNWVQVGGIDAPIELYARKGSISGVGYAIRQYVFQNSDEEFDAKFSVASSGPMEKAIEKNINGIGITGISSAKKRKLKILAYDNKLPTYENVKKGKYGLYRPLYLVTSSSPSKTVKTFVAFAQSTDGRNIIRNNQTLPYTDALGLMRKMLIYGFGVN